LKPQKAAILQGCIISTFRVTYLKAINWFKKTNPLDDLIEPNDTVAMWCNPFWLGEGGDFKHQC